MGCGCNKNAIKKAQPVSSSSTKKVVLSGSPNKARVASSVRRIIKRRAR